MKTSRGHQHALNRINSGAVLTEVDLEAELARRTDLPEQDYHTSALEKMDKTLTELLQFTEQAKTILHDIPVEDWRYMHRTSGEQTRMEVGLYERALDRAARVLKDVSKMALEEKVISLGKAQTELVIRILMGTIMEMGLDAASVSRARTILLRRFQEEANLSSRLEANVTKELESGMVVDA
jgi:RNA polymerase-interacting CarD/CdnL/TRCF family regulator